MPTLPAEMTAIAIRTPGGPEVLVPETAAVAATRRGRGSGQGRSRRRQPPRRDATPGPLSAAERRDRYSRARTRRRSCGAWPERETLEGRRQAHRLGGRRRLRAILRRARAAGAADSDRADDDRSGGDAGDLLHRVAQRVRARRAKIRREHSRAWRQLRHRHCRDPCWPRRLARACSLQPDRRKNARPARKLGAELAINYKTEDFVAAVKAATGGNGVNVILDMVGGDYIDRNYDAAAVEGRIVQIAFLDSAKATVDFRRMLGKRLTHTGSGLRPRSVADKGKMARAMEERCGRCFPPDGSSPSSIRRFRSPRRRKAHARMESGAAYRQDRSNSLSAGQILVLATSCQLLRGSTLEGAGTGGRFAFLALP